MVPVPSLFFIGENGTPLEIIAGSVTADDLVSKINNVLTQAGKSNKSSSLSLIDAEQKAAAASNSNNTVAESAESNINDAKHSNSNTDLTTSEPTTADVPSNKDVTEDSIKATTLLNTENTDNNEKPQENVEKKQEIQNNELTAEVYVTYINMNIESLM